MRALSTCQPSSSALRRSGSITAAMLGASMETLIEYRDVRVDGDDGPIVAGFSAAVPAGRLTVMVGPSGAGKTTLLRLLNRLDDPDGGAVFFDGRDVRRYDVLDLRRRVPVVGQAPVTFPGTVADNVGELHLPPPAHTLGGAVP